MCRLGIDPSTCVIPGQGLAPMRYTIDITLSSCLIRLNVSQQDRKRRCAEAKTHLCWRDTILSSFQSEWWCRFVHEAQVIASKQLLQTTLPWWIECIKHYNAAGNEKKIGRLEKLQVRAEAKAPLRARPWKSLPLLWALGFPNNPQSCLVPLSNFVVREVLNPWQ